ncbi:uncharacterized protein LOC144632227, partial [Oculina patagonica]
RGNLNGSETSANEESGNCKCGPEKCRDFFTAVLSVITAGCIPKQRRFNVPFSFENPVYGSQTIEDIVGTANSNATNSTQDKQGVANSQRSYSCTHVTNLQREQKKPGAQRTERKTEDKRNFNTDVEKTASQPEAQTHPLLAPVVVNGSCKESSCVSNGNVETRKCFIGNDSAPEDGETVSMPESAASPDISENNCSGRNLGESDRSREVHKASSVKLEKKPGRIQRFLSNMSSVFTCCGPSAKQFHVPFSFKNPVH